jgi:hypothetical protein
MQQFTFIMSSCFQRHQNGPTITSRPNKSRPPAQIMWVDDLRLSEHEEMTLYYLFPFQTCHITPTLQLNENICAMCSDTNAILYIVEYYTEFCKPMG